MPCPACRKARRYRTRLEPGQRYPALILVFSEGGHARFMADVQADASSSLAHDWPGLQQIIDLQPFLEPHEREDEHLQVLANHYWVEQPQGIIEPLAGHEGLRAALVARQSRLSRRLQQVARFFLNHPEEVAITEYPEI